MRLIDADMLDEEVMHLFIAITGTPKQSTVVNECKKSFRKMIDEQPTINPGDVETVRRYETQYLDDMKNPLDAAAGSVSEGRVRNMIAVPMELKDAQNFINAHHRHHQASHRDKFRIAASDGKNIVGVIQVGRPVSRVLDDGKTLEVLRLCSTGEKKCV